MRVTEQIKTVMRDADPAPRVLEGGERAEADLERILRQGHLDAVTDRQPAFLPRRPSRLVPGLAAVAACSAAAVAFSVLPLGGGQTSAYAATPPPLEYTKVNTSVPASTLLERIAGDASQLREATGPEMRLHHREWNLNTSVHADDSAVSDVAEEEYRTVVDADGSATVQHTDEDGDTDSYTTDVELAPKDPEEFTAWLANRPGDWGFNHPAGAAQITSDLLRQQALTPAQRAALLRALADLPGLTYDGKVTDRAGRQGWAFSADAGRGDDLPTRHTFIIDPETGTVLGQESMLTKDAGALNVPIPAVTDYDVYLSAERTS